MENNEKVIIIRYGEIFLKGKNRNFFESLLIKNIKETLKGFEYKFAKTQARYFVENFSDDDEYEILDRLQKVFGIHSLSVAYKVRTDFDTDFQGIKNIVADLARDAMLDTTKADPSFRMTVKRADKRIPMTSSEIAADIADAVIKATNFVVNLKDYDFEFMVDIRENGFAFVYMGKIMGAGGLPVGSSNKGLLLLSGGIDSPVAAYMMAKRGMKLQAIHFCSPPYTSDKAKEKVVDLKGIVEKWTSSMKLFVVPFTEIQMEIHKNCPAEFMITIMRRFMMRIASIIAKQNSDEAIITGECLGQVASQTVESMTSTEDTALLPIFRPLIAFDKEEIMALAEKIGTYETSILPFEDCCTVFLPKNPAIRPNLEKVRTAEKALDIDALVARAIENIEIVY